MCDVIGNIALSKSAILGPSPGAPAKYILFVMIGLIIYLGIGIILTLYWWNKGYKKSYEEAKASEEGVEKGMVTIVLLLSLFLWPVVGVYKFVTKKLL